MAHPDRALAVDAGLTGVLGVVFLASTAGASDARPLDGLGWALLAANVLPPAGPAPCRWRCWWRRPPWPCGGSGTPEPGTPPPRPRRWGRAGPFRPPSLAAYRAWSALATSDQLGARPRGRPSRRPRPRPARGSGRPGGRSRSWPGRRRSSRSGRPWCGRGARHAGGSRWTASPGRAAPIPPPPDRDHAYGIDRTGSRLKPASPPPSRPPGAGGA
jgi:hypothetical protein